MIVNGLLHDGEGRVKAKHHKLLQTKGRRNESACRASRVGETVGKDDFAAPQEGVGAIPCPSTDSFGPSNSSTNTFVPALAAQLTLPERCGLVEVAIVESVVVLGHSHSREEPDPAGKIFGVRGRSGDEKQMGLRDQS
jgi:hypothetical protein